MRETHETVERHGVGGEVDTLSRGNTEGVCVESKPRNIDVIGDDFALNVAGTVGNSEGLVGIYEGRR